MARHGFDSHSIRQIAKAFLNEEGTSLSCDTINWLNSRTGNAHCTPVKTQKSKTKFFGWLLNEEKETIDCSAADFITKVKDTADCFLAGAVKDKCNRRGDTPLLPGFGCCDLDEYDIRENTIFYRASGSERVVDDLEELDRFIQFKVNELALKCPVKAGAHPRSHASKKKETPAKHKKPAVRKRHTTDKASKRHPLDMGHHQT